MSSAARTLPLYIGAPYFIVICVLGLDHFLYSNAYRSEADRAYGFYELIARHNFFASTTRKLAYYLHPDSRPHNECL